MPCSRTNRHRSPGSSIVFTGFLYCIVVGIESDRELAIELDGSKETPYLMSRSLKEGRVVLDAEDTKFDVELDSIKRAEEIKDFDCSADGKTWAHELRVYCNNKSKTKRDTPVPELVLFQP